MTPLLSLVALFGVVAGITWALSGMQRLARRPDDRAEFEQIGQRDPRPAAIAALRAADLPIYDEARAVLAKAHADRRARLRAKLAAKVAFDDTKVVPFRKAGRS